MDPAALNQNQPTLFLSGGPFTAHSIIYDRTAFPSGPAWYVQSDEWSITQRSVVASLSATSCAQLVGVDVPASQSTLVARHACSCVQPTKTVYFDYTNFTCTSTFDVVNSGVAPITVAAQSAQNLVSGPILRIARQLATYPVGLSVHAIEVDWACNADSNAQLAVLLRDASGAASVAVASGFASYVRDPIQGGTLNRIPVHSIEGVKTVATLDLPRCDGLHCGVDAQCGAGYAVFVPEGVDPISVGQNGIAYGGAQCVYMTPVNSTVDYALIRNDLVMYNATRVNFYNASVGLWRQDSHTSDTNGTSFLSAPRAAISEIINSLVATVAADAVLGDNIGLAEPRDVAFNDTVRARAILMRQCMDFTAQSLDASYELTIEAVNAYGDAAAARITENFERGFARYNVLESGRALTFNMVPVSGTRATRDIVFSTSPVEVNPARVFVGPTLTLANLEELYGYLGYGLAEAEAYIRVNTVLQARRNQWLASRVPIPPYPAGTWAPGEPVRTQAGVTTTYTFVQAQAVAAPFDLRVMLSELSDLDVVLVNTSNIYFYTGNGNLTPFVILSELKNGTIAQSDFITFSRITHLVTIYLEYEGRIRFLKTGRGSGARSESDSDMYRTITSDEARAKLHAYMQSLGRDKECVSPGLDDVGAELPVDAESVRLFTQLAQKYRARVTRDHGPPAKGDSGGTMVPPIPILSLEATRQHAYECAVYMAISISDSTDPVGLEDTTVGSYVPWTVLPKVITLKRAGAFDGVMDVLVPTIFNQTRLTIERAYATGGISLAMRDYLLYVVDDYFVILGSASLNDPELVERMSRYIVDGRHMGITSRRAYSFESAALVRATLKRGRTVAFETSSDLRANALNAVQTHMIKLFPGLNLPPMWQPTWLDDPATRDLMIASAPATFIIAHELGHAISTLVTKFDRDGRLIDWASPTDKARISSQLQCLDRYLFSLPAFYGTLSRNTTSLSEEGFSDWWGLRIMFDLTNARHTAQNITDEQRRSELRHVCYGFSKTFSFAYSRTGEISVQNLNGRVHPIDDARVMMPAMFAEFYEAFESEAMRPPDAPYPTGIPRCGNLGLVS